MKKIQKAVTKFFSSKNGNFEITVEAQFQRANEQNVLIPNTYVTKTGNTAILNPSIYLVFAYRAWTENYLDDSTLYMSYPNMAKLRDAVSEMRRYSLEGFAEVDGLLVVKPGYTEPMFVYNIGRNNKWVSFKLAVIDSSENGVSQRIPAIQIELSGSKGFTSVLTLEEFDSVYTIVHDINLPNLQVSLSVMFISSEDEQQGQRNNYRAAGYPAGYQQPRYNNQTFPQQQPRYNNQTVPQPQQANQQFAPRRAAETGNNPSPKELSSASISNTLPPRSEKKPIINMSNVEDVPVDNISFDDSDAIDNIFEGNE